MSDDIVRLLRGNSSKRLKSLKESMPIQGLKEADEDEENILPPEEEEMPDVPEEDIPAEEETPEEETEDTEEAEIEPADDKNQNPLDNPYAVNYQIGDTVSLSFADGTKTKVSGIIEGYDKEGFYRIKWDSGKTTNGITDLALAELIEDMEEKCVCGSEEFVTEGKKLVCDKCGRVIKENKTVNESKLYDIRYNYEGDELSDYAANILVVADSPDMALQIAKEKEPEGRHFSIDKTYDSVSDYKEKHPKSNKRIVQEDKDPLTKADAARPRGKKLIRSEAHPMSTQMTEATDDEFYVGWSKTSLEDFDKYLNDHPSLKIYKRDNGHYYLGTGIDDRYSHQVDDKIIKKLQSDKRFMDKFITEATHNLSKKDIRDSIRSAFAKKKIEESSEEDSLFSRLSEIGGEFWTRLSELIADVRELGYDVLDANSEYLVIGIEDDEEEYHQMKLPIGGTSRTMTIDIDRAEVL